MKRSELTKLIRECIVEAKQPKARKSSTITISLPKILGSNDYHQFSDYVEVLKALTGKTVKFTELNSDEDDDNYDPRTAKIRYPYVAEFYI